MPGHSRQRAPGARSSGGAPSGGRAANRQDRLGNDGVRQVRRAPSQSGGPEGEVLDQARVGGGGPVPFRAELEASFGADLSEVRAWLGVDLSGIEASAAASGTEVYFEERNPTREQVAHELAHVLQQHGGRGTSSPQDASERDAVDAGARAARGEAVEVTPGSDGRGVHRDAAPPSRAGDVKTVKLAPGSTYKVVADDLASGEAAAWERIAERFGMKPGHLTAFNTHVQTVAESGGQSPRQVTPALKVGVELYVPSSAEILFGQCVTKAGDLTSGTNLYKSVSAGANDELMAAARNRASGKVGEGYGTAGVNGIFYSPNAALAGASAKRSEKVGKQTEYRVNWGSDFWKCSVFMNDVVFQAGYKPALMENKHYSTAGNAETSGAYTEVPVGQAAPGHLWQRDGGSGQDQSHNAVLSSFVTVTNLDAETDIWKFDIVGAEKDRAAESEQTYHMKKGTNVKTDGKVVRFLKPKAKR